MDFHCTTDMLKLEKLVRSISFPTQVDPGGNMSLRTHANSYTRQPDTNIGQLVRTQIRTHAKSYHTRTRTQVYFYVFTGKQLFHES